MKLEHIEVCLPVNMKAPVERACAPVRVQAAVVESGRSSTCVSFYFEKKEARSPDEGGGTGVASQVSGDHRRFK